MSPARTPIDASNYRYVVLDQWGPDITKTAVKFWKEHQILGEYASLTLVEDLFDLVDNIAGGERGPEYNAQKLWFHQLCRRIQKHSKQSSADDHRPLLPFACLFVEILRDKQEHLRADFDCTDEGQIAIMFETEWRKVLVPEDETLVSLAKTMALDRPQGFREGTYGLLLDIAFHLQDLRGNEPICIPTSDRTADIIGVSGRFLSTLIDKAQTDGFLKVVSKAYKAGVQARTFKFVVPAAEPPLALRVEESDFDPYE